MYDNNMKFWTEVRQAVLGNGLSETQACQRFDIHSDTLKRILARLREEHGYLGGVPKLIKFDNSKVAVRKIIGFRGSEPTREFLRLVSHFLFQHHFCQVRQPQEKGHVAALFGRSSAMFPQASWAVNCFSTSSRPLMKE